MPKLISHQRNHDKPKSKLPNQSPRKKPDKKKNKTNWGHWSGKRMKV